MLEMNNLKKNKNLDWIGHELCMINQVRYTASNRPLVNI